MSPYRRSVELEQSPALRAKTAVVTGATGFLASHLTEQLLRRSWQVVALSRNGSDTSLLQRFAKENPQGKLSLVSGDITDYASLQRAVPKDTAVMFHVAALVMPWFGANNQMYDVNVLGTRNIVNVCLEKNVQKLVHTSSDAVFRGPHRLLQDVMVTELVPHFGLFNWQGYDNTKALAELEVLAGIEDGQWATILNPAGILGKYDINGFARVGRMLKRNELPAIPNCTYSMASAYEISLAHIAAAERGRLGRNYLLCGPTISYSDLINVVQTVFVCLIETCEMWSLVLEYSRSEPFRFVVGRCCSRRRAAAFDCSGIYFEKFVQIFFDFLLLWTLVIDEHRRSCWSSQ